MPDHITNLIFTKICGKGGNRQSGQGRLQRNLREMEQFAEEKLAQLLVDKSYDCATNQKLHKQSGHDSFCFHGKVKVICIFLETCFDPEMLDYCYLLF